jgi:hypothetical protein
MLFLPSGPATLSRPCPILEAALACLIILASPLNNRGWSEGNAFFQRNSQILPHLRIEFLANCD